MPSKGTARSVVLSACVAAAAMTLAAGRAWAGTTTTWTGAAGNALWTDAGNWSDGVPTATGTALFAQDVATVDLGGSSPSVGGLQLNVNPNSVATLTLTNGVLRTDNILSQSHSISYSGHIDGTVAAVGTLLNVSGDTRVYGAIGDGLGGGSFDVRGDALVLFGDNTYHGSTLGNTYVFGSIRNSPLLWVTGGFLIDSRSSDGNCVADSAEIRMDGGELNVVTPEAGERVGAIDVRRASNFNFSPQYISTGPLFRSASLSREGGAVLFLTEKENPTQPSPNWRWTIDAAPALSGDGSSLPTHRGILKGLALDDSGGQFPSTFVTYDPSPDPSHPGDVVGVRRLASSEYAPDLSGSSQNANVRLPSSQTLSTSLTINSLILDPAATRLTIGDGATLTISSGMFMSLGNSPTVDGGGRIDLVGEGIVVGGGDFNVPITAESLTITRSVRLHRPNNITGPVVIDNGNVTVDADGALGTGSLRLTNSTLTIPVVWSFAQPFAVGGRSTLVPNVTHGYGTFALDGPLMGDGTLSTSDTLMLHGGADVQKMHIEASHISLSGTFTAPSRQDLDLLTEGNLSGNATFLGSATALYFEPGIENGGVGSVGRMVFDRYAGDSEDGRYIPSYRFDLLGNQPGTDYDQLVVLSGIDLSGDGASVPPAFLVLRPGVGFAPTLGEQFLLIDNQGPDPIGGRFVFPEGGVFLRGGYAFQITYLGGDGNDLVVTVVPEPTLGALGWLALGAFGASRRIHRARSVICC